MGGALRAGARTHTARRRGGLRLQEWGPPILTQGSPLHRALILVRFLTLSHQHNVLKPCNTLPRAYWPARHTSAPTARPAPGNNTQRASQPRGRRHCARNVPERGFLRTIWRTFRNSRFQLCLRAQVQGAGCPPSGAGEPEGLGTCAAESVSRNALWGLSSLLCCWETQGSNQKRTAETCRAVRGSSPAEPTAGRLDGASRHSAATQKRWMKVRVRESEESSGRGEAKRTVHSRARPGRSEELSSPAPRPLPLGQAGSLAVPPSSLHGHVWGAGPKL